MKFIDFIKLHKTKCLMGGLWLSLGAYRGVKEYEFYMKKANYPFFYTDVAIRGGFGVFVYANPFFFPWMSYKEILRLEKTVRSLQKTDDDYKILC
jgi:hypothetical protein